MAQISDSEIHRIVQQVVNRTLGGSSGAQVSTIAQASTIAQPTTNTQSSTNAQPAASVISSPSATPQKTVAIASDHGGFAMKEMLKAYLVELGHTVTDCGTSDGKTAVDYPDLALAVALLVKEGKAWRGIVVDGAGIGSCMAANKVPGVRAALCYDYATAVNSREHNNANLLTLGAGLIGDNLAKQIVKTWLATEFGGARHQKRIDKIIAIENRFMKG
jgi:ribose 5-phosphate isomerase B